VQGYAYDFEDMALVMRDEQRLMARWRKLYPGSIFEVHYEQLAADSENVIARLGAWLGLPAQPATNKASRTISTASLWQARQPVYTRSVERWRNYVEFVPELLKFAAE